MKNVTAMIITMAMLCAVSCSNNTNGPEVTTGGTIAPTVTTGGESSSPIETAETTEPVETVETTVTEETVDIEELLAGYTVYDVTLEMASYHKPYEDLKKLDVSERPEKIALRFADAEGLTIMMELTETSEGWHNYYVRHIFTDTVSISVNHESDFVYLERTFWIANNDGIILINNGSEASAEYYFISGGEYDVVKNDSLESGYVLEFYEKNGNFEYAKISRKYYYAVQTLEDLINAYESDDDFYMETGSFAFETNGFAFVPENTMTFGEWYSLDSFPYKDYCEKYGKDSFVGVIEAYNKHNADGNLDEFWIN